MHYGVRAISGKRSVSLLPICKIAFNEIRPGINGASMAFTQVVENGNFMRFIQQELGANAPDVACAANHKDFHWREKCSLIGTKSKATHQGSALFRAGLLVAC